MNDVITGFYNLRATVGGRPDAGLSQVNVCPISGRAQSGVWIVKVVQNLAQPSPDVCDARPDIGQALTD